MVVAVESKDFMRANETKMNGKSLTAVIMHHVLLFFEHESARW